MCTEGRPGISATCGIVRLDLETWSAASPSVHDHCVVLEEIETETDAGEKGRTIKYKLWLPRRSSRMHETEVRKQKRESP